jgi:hypothetical protein
MVPIDHHARPVRRQAGQDRDRIRGFVRKQDANRLSGGDGGIDRMTETPACRPDLCVGQVPVKIFAGNPISEFLRG